MPATKNGRRTVSQGDRRQSDGIQKAEQAARSFADDALQTVRSYVNEKPEQAALWCLGIGFVLGWKLKPW
jgi:hypothetical protein